MSGPEYGPDVSLVEVKSLKEDKALSSGTGAEHGAVSAPTTPK